MTSAWCGRWQTWIRWIWSWPCSNDNKLNECYFIWVNTWVARGSQVRRCITSQISCSASIISFWVRLTVNKRDIIMNSVFVGTTFITVFHIFLIRQLCVGVAPEKCFSPLTYIYSYTYFFTPLFIQIIEFSDNSMKYVCCTYTHSFFNFESWIMSECKNCF